MGDEDEGEAMRRWEGIQKEGIKGEKWIKFNKVKQTHQNKVNIYNITDRKGRLISKLSERKDISNNTAQGSHWLQKG